MRQTHRRSFLLSAAMVAGALGAGGAARAQTPPSDGKVYVCPHCGCPADGKEFPAPGNCPACQMPLIEKATAPDGRKTVAILVFDGVQIIDFAAPYEVFGQAGYRPFTVAATKAPVTTTMQLSVTPAFSFADCPRPEILMIPGGSIHAASRNPEILAWLRLRSAESAVTMTVCNGALIAARAGLLDGLKATTFYQAIEGMQQDFPRVAVVSDQRFVDNGKVVTSAGLSAGIDAALHVVSRLSSPARAQLTALNMEYDWKAEGTYARASFADYPLRRALGANLDLPLPTGYRATLESTSGDSRTWNAVWSIQTSASLGDIAKVLDDMLSAKGLRAERAASASQRAWRLVDAQRRTWRLALDVTAASGNTRARITSRRAA